ncbi:hypothetical protein COO09_16645 [Rhizorhabdus dicambivorans]|uniref:Membrane dipeptidase n=1 Tax=Rhizorhabdus dicambivorans TaxID=1850238 RepID=A0A2A4FUQ5_9SPHN|nr:membrane dipeptidase [Rhizorhabdus dicambivorans]ATE65786.1 hypothetical protein CMV14_16415 [Rhizorhabdus dicambivorans]PCE41131.1 hypothetical protein COO09_16645 [Rhizorhabdus dicambivorans]
MSSPTRPLCCGFDIVSLNIGFGPIGWAEQIRVVFAMRAWIGERPHRYRLVASVDDIVEARAARLLAISFDIEGMDPVVDRPDLVRSFHTLGVRWMLIAYNRNNAAGGGCLDLDPGLTPAGRAIIDEMERDGMVLCLTHAGTRR